MLIIPATERLMVDMRPAIRMPAGCSMNSNPNHRLISRYLPGILEVTVSGLNSHRGQLPAASLVGGVTLPRLPMSSMRHDGMCRLISTWVVWAINVRANEIVGGHDTIASFHDLGKVLRVRSKQVMYPAILQLRDSTPMIATDQSTVARRWCAPSSYTLSQFARSAVSSVLTR